MDPIDIEYSSKKGYVIIHKCRVCGSIKKNKAALDLKEGNDSLEAILDIMKGKLR